MDPALQQGDHSNSDAEGILLWRWRQRVITATTHGHGAALHGVVDGNLDARQDEATRRHGA
jgi:hypothetical protein